MRRQLHYIYLVRPHLEYVNVVCGLFYKNRPTGDRESTKENHHID